MDIDNVDPLLIYGMNKLPSLNIGNAFPMTHEGVVTSPYIFPDSYAPLISWHFWSGNM